MVHSIQKALLLLMIQCLELHFPSLETLQGTVRQGITSLKRQGSIPPSACMKVEILRKQRDLRDLIPLAAAEILATIKRNFQGLIPLVAARILATVTKSFQGLIP